MSDTVFAEALKKQFGKAFDVLAEAVGTFTPEQWRAGGSPYTGPGRATAHALVCAEFYTCGERSALEHFGKAVWQMTDEDVPDQDTQKAYLAECRGKALSWIDRLAAGGFATADAEEGTTELEQVVYAVRHLQHHTGEVSAYQKQSGIPVRGWD